MKKARSLSLVMLVLVMLATGRAATPLSEYQVRVGQAAQMATEVIEQIDAEEPDEAVINDTLARLRAMLPATEDIELNGEVIHVDNVWLHQMPDAQRSSEALTIIAERLAALERRLKVTLNSPRPAAEEQARLERILAQPDYQDELRQESAVQRWLRELMEKILRFLAQLFQKQPRTAERPGTRTLDLFRLLLLAVTAAALIFGLLRLAGRFRRRVKAEREKPEAREILGELIEEGTTAEDLFRNAAELARQGNYRLAIRRAYIALLYELELRGNLQLHHSRTNRDYLNELRAMPHIHTPVEELTSTFERTWYGEAETRLEDYAGFVEKYREVVRVR